MGKLACHGSSFGKGAVVGMDKHNRRLNKEYGNENIDISKTADNIVFYTPKVSMYQDSKKMINERVRANNGRVRSDSNWISEFIIYAPVGVKMTLEREREYFQTVHDYFLAETGQENLLSSIVHKDEATAHMHYSFCPITKDNRLSSKNIMTRQFLRQIHNELPKVLQDKGFDVQRGDQVKPEDRSKKGRSVNRYKADAEREKQEVEKELEQVQFQVLEVENDLIQTQSQVIEVENDLIQAQSHVIEAEKELEQIQFQINDKRDDLRTTQEELDRLQPELKEVSNELQKKGTELNHICEELDKIQSKILGGYEQIKENQGIIDKQETLISFTDRMLDTYKNIQEVIIEKQKILGGLTEKSEKILKMRSEQGRENKSIDNNRKSFEVWKAQAQKTREEMQKQNQLRPHKNRDYGEDR